MKESKLKTIIRLMLVAGLIVHIYIATGIGITIFAIGIFIYLEIE